MYNEGDWREYAACRDTTSVKGKKWIFFPHSSTKSWDKPRAICAGCPVALQCLAYAIDNDIEYGMWGGLTPEERGHRPYYHRVQRDV